MTLLCKHYEIPVQLVIYIEAISYRIMRGTDRLCQAPVQEWQMFYLFLKLLHGTDVKQSLLPQRDLSSPFSMKAVTCWGDPTGCDFSSFRPSAPPLAGSVGWHVFLSPRSCKCSEQRGLAIARDTN